MAEFFTTINPDNIAKQIAFMLNTYNLWKRNFSARSIKESQIKYFVDLYCDRVVGCAGMTIENNYTKIQHVCVLPEFRGMKIASRLVNTCITESITEYIKVTIREDNVASLTLFQKLGFNYIDKFWSMDHWTLIFGRRKINV